MRNLSKRKVVILMGVLAVALIAVMIVMPAGTDVNELRQINSIR